MTSLPVIQFTELEKMLDELSHCTVRVQVLELSKPLSSQMSLRQVTVGVHIRAVSNGQRRGCHLQVGQIDLFNGRREGDPLWQQYDALWEEADSLLGRVVKHLESLMAEKNLTIKTAGIIDFGDTKIINGHWAADPGEPAPDFPS